VLDQARELSSIAGAEFAGSDGFVEELFRLGADGAELREGDGVELGIGQIDLEISEAVRHCFRSGSEAGAIGVKLDKSFEGRGVFGADGGELLRDCGGSSAAHGQEQAALGAEALDERSGDDASFLGDVSEGQLRGAAPLHDAGGGGEELFVGGFAWAWAHFGLAAAARFGFGQRAAAIITEWPFIFLLTLVNGGLVLGRSASGARPSRWDAAFH
jgi:hypothetical protein